MARGALRQGPRPDADARAVRPVSALQREASIRIVFRSIPASWESTSSALMAWGSFMDACFPASPRFPPVHAQVEAFAAFFRNVVTFAKYMQHVRVASRVLYQRPEYWPEWFAALQRGMGAGAVTARQPSRFRLAEVRKLVAKLQS